MKIKIKAAVVLNPHETSVIAGVLARQNHAGPKVAETTKQRVEEEKVIEEFLAKRQELQERLA